MSDSTTTPHDLNYELIAAETDDDMAEAAIKALLDKVEFLQRQADKFAARNEELYAEQQKMQSDLDACFAPEDAQMQHIVNLTGERDQLRKDLATATDKHAKATAANAEIARERDAAKALCETALKAQKRAEDAATGMNAEHIKQLQDDLGIANRRIEAYERLNADLIKQRDGATTKNNDLHKEIEALTASKRNQDRAIQTFVGAASRPVSGPCELVIRSKPVNGLGEVTFDIPAGYSLFSSDIVADRHWVRMTRTAAVEMPVDDAPEQAKPNDDEAIPQAA